MNTTRRTFSTVSLAAALALGAVVGGIIYAVLQPDAPADWRALRSLAVFDKEDVRLMTNHVQATGVRFYLAKEFNLTVVAGPIKADLVHCPETVDPLYQRFRRLNGSTADIDLVNEATAERSVKASYTTAKPTWSVDASTVALDDLLNVAGASGIALIERKTTTNEWTFELVPVRINGGVATAVGGLNDRLSAAPCPRFCGAEARHYLHQR